MLQSIAKQWKLSASATGSRNRALAFLLGIHAGLGAQRLWARKWFKWMIGRFAAGERVVLRFQMNGRRLAIGMRKDDRTDYLVVGELIQGGYDAPDVKPARIVDAGGNIGTFTLAAAARFPGVPITVFEPNEANLAVLGENLRMNGIEAEIICKGVWSAETTLYFQPLDSYSGFISDRPSEIAVQCVVPEVGAKDWLKLDVEGAEYEVLPALFAKGCFPYFVSLELHHRKERGDALIGLARSNGYSIRGPVEADADCINLALKRELP